MTLSRLGWTDAWASAFEAVASHDPRLFAARVVSAQREHYLLWSEDGPVTAVLSGRLRHHAARRELPIVGDWVAARRQSNAATLHAVLPRRVALVRRAAGTSAAPQLIAANVDCVFIVSSLNQDWNPRRIERALALVWEAGAQPVLLLSKLDLCSDLEAALAAAQAVAAAVPVHALSVHARLGLEALAPYFGVGRTLAVLGSSGVGKSSLVNWLLGEERLATGSIRAGDDKGRHTTSRRELFALPQGGLLIDTPGVRELGMFDAQTGLSVTFDDLTGLAEGCRFADCQHGAEPGCAIQAALVAGTLERARYQAWLKLQQEEAHQQRRADLRLHMEHKQKLKQRQRRLRDHYKQRG